MDTSRESLQAVGAELEANDAVLFCRSVLDEAGWSAGESAVVEGIRHVRILNTLKSLVAPQPVFLVYLEAPAELRRTRLQERGARRRLTTSRERKRTQPNGTSLPNSLSWRISCSPRKALLSPTWSNRSKRAYGRTPPSVRERLSMRIGPLRANIDETVPPVIITEQGENRNQCEEQRNVFGFSVAPAPPSPPRPDPEVVADARRRTFTAEYKLRILAEADAAAAQPGAIGALQRREGLYSSHLVTWRRERQAGILKGLTPHKRGPKSNGIRWKSKCRSSAGRCVRIVPRSEKAALAYGRRITPAKPLPGSLARSRADYAPLAEGLPTVLASLHQRISADTIETKRTLTALIQELIAESLRLCRAVRPSGSME